MKKYGKKGFTLIELIVVLVIMAIIALIATPLVMSIIRKARISADKRSIDAYGRSIELAIAGYLLDTGNFPTDVSQLTIEYSGDEVVCTITQINSNSRVYLTGCTVNGRSVEGYTYGKEEIAPTYTAYEVGDTVTYNNIDYYVIKHSGAKESTVTLLKAEPLTVAEVNQYGAGHVNRYTSNSVGTASNQNGYGGMAYYTSETCGYVNNNTVKSGCTTDYAASEIKYAVDAWKTANASTATEARLFSRDEYVGLCEEKQIVSSAGDQYYTVLIPQYDWMTNNNYWYLTNTPDQDSSSNIWSVNSSLGSFDVYTDNGVVRPVIVLPKSAL